jgi:hypothetical protein
VRLCQVIILAAHAMARRAAVVASPAMPADATTHFYACWNAPDAPVYVHTSGRREARRVRAQLETLAIQRPAAVPATLHNAAKGTAIAPLSPDELPVVYDVALGQVVRDDELAARFVAHRDADDPMDLETRPSDWTCVERAPVEACPEIQIVWV